MDLAFAALDAKEDHSGDGPQPEPRREPEKPATAKPADKPTEKPTEVADANKPVDKPKEANASDDPVGDETDRRVDSKIPEKPVEKAGEGKPKEKHSLGYLYREKEKEAAQLAQERDTLRKEIETLKSKPATPADDPEKKQLSERLHELEDHIRFVDYTKSKEYLEQYQKPYEETASAAVSRATQLKVTNEDGSKRNMTPDEFWQIVHIGDEDDALAAAEKLFGEGSLKAQNVIERRNEIVRAHNATEAAKEKYRKEGTERSKKAQEQWEAQQRQAAEQSTARAAKFKEMNETGEKHEKMKDVFAAAEGDAEGAELLAKYRHETDRAFAGGAQLKEGDEPWTPDQLLSKHSVIRNRAGAFPYAVRQYRNAVKKIAELEAKIAGFQKSEPGDGEVKGDAPTAVADAWSSANAKLEALNRELQ